MPRKTKAERQKARAGRIEKRKGLAAGEGQKIIDNRATRRRELFYTPEAGEGKFTKKLSQGDLVKADQTSQSNSPTYTPPATSGGMENTSNGEGNVSGSKGSIDFSALKRDSTDISSNMTQMYLKKKGY